MDGNSPEPPADATAGHIQQQVSAKNLALVGSETVGSGGRSLLFLLLTIHSDIMEEGPIT
ncbi:hypothetical protein ASPCADRAFT_202286 [Aspergillus carbonarius ITEM 5010]|uniref:Uncharacterized protein n=1 Tax=Aspergillus carbonarius (strain ITEM 5010) TaxID=602072 RepID=A0A1R3S116_ASPC5|nr:hypothetical protein ASPCADRAFT_202286 [Aspergillus carbonarius ITEM 5010]